MQIGILLAGLVFFFNPNIEIIDLLPDFIGCALLLWGTRKFCILSERGSAAARAFRILLLTNLAKTVCILLFLLISEKEMTWMLVLTSVFGVLEAVLFLYGWRQFSEALVFRGMLYSYEGVYGKNLSALNGMVTLFTVLKCLLSLLPELTFLATDYGDVRPIETDWTFLWRILTGVNLAATTLFGLLFLWLAFRYFRTLQKEEAGFLSAVEEEYRREIVARPGVLPYLHLRTASVLLLCGMLFLIPLQIDGVDFLPSFVGAAFLLSAVLLLRQEYPKAVKKAAVLLGAFALLAAGEWLGDLLLQRSTHYSILGEQQLSYASYLSQFLYHDPDTYYRFLVLLALTALRCIVMAAAMLAVYRLFRQIVLEHTGAALNLDTPASREKTARIHKSLCRFLLVLSVFAVLGSVGSFLTKALMLTELPFPVWLPDFLLNLAGAALCRMFTYSLTEHMDQKYYFSEYIGS